MNGKHVQYNRWLRRVKCDQLIIDLNAYQSLIKTYFNNVAFGNRWTLDELVETHGTRCVCHNNIVIKNRIK